MTIFRKISFTSVAIAVLLTSSAPAMAAGLSRASTSAHHDTKSVVTAAQDYRRRYRHHNRVRTGDVLTGIGILAGIAILASASNKEKYRDRNQTRYPDNYPDNRAPNHQDDQRQSLPDRDDRRAEAGQNDVGAAVAACSDAAESRSENQSRGDVRVEEIRSVTRDGAGWRVEGAISGGDARNFSCGVTGGQVDFIQFNR